MKKLIIFCFTISNYAFAQSILITNKALVLPQYPGETAVVAAIPSPDNGMLVFNNSVSKIMTYEPISATWRNVVSTYHIDNQPAELFIIRNENTSGFANGILAQTNASFNGKAITGVAYNISPSGDTYGVNGTNKSLNTFGFGVFGLHEGNGTAIMGQTLGTGAGMRGVCLNGVGVNGISSTGTGVRGASSSGLGVIGESTTSNGVTGITDSGLGINAYASGLGTGINGVSNLGTGGFFQSFNSTALQTGTGNIGFGTIPNLNTNERMDINGRVRVKHNVETAGIWFNNSSNTIASIDGAFFGIQNAAPSLETAGIYIGNAWRFTVDRMGNATFAGNVTASCGVLVCSDLRYKRNITSLNNSLDNILKINGVRYDFRKNEFPERNFSDKNQIGFIAQEIEKIYPEMVFTDEKGYKSVDYAKLTPVLVEAIKEQQKEIEILKKMAMRTDKELESIKNMLQAQHGK